MNGIFYNKEDLDRAEAQAQQMRYVFDLVEQYKVEDQKRKEKKQ